MHDSTRPASDNVPATATSVWDLVHAGHITVSDGTCPAGAPHCCPRKDPLAVWGNARNPLVAICSGVTSRSVKKEDMHPGHLALFQKLMPSIVKTVDCDVDYMIVIGFDKGDQFYDTKEGQEEVRVWFAENMATPLADIGIGVQFMMVEVDNQVQKPGPVFNAMLREAYHAGADYFYRLNDDSELQFADYGGEQVSWVKVFIRSLHKFAPPYGVVGPWGGLDRILTHDFVHRMHMDIFDQVYYPAVFTDWYMDDWVSRVYGIARTIKASKFNVEHHTTHHGQRYKVDRSNERHLVPQIDSCKTKIADYARAKFGDEVANQIAGDRKKPPPFQDISCDEWTGLNC
ncbi:hypothetical protein TeGR_g2588 [Tetraparma gracilis]|nr:hypothetical protein TeGR_g2588 [Tetraparma gracilis]